MPLVTKRSGRRTRPIPPRSRSLRRPDPDPVRPLGSHRRVIPGATWHITKKTNDDHFFLVPSFLINAILLYLLVLKAKRYGVLLHSFQFLSNHFHLVITDPKGEYPAFMRELCGESGKALKLVRRTSRTIWSKQEYSAVQLLDRDAAERACAYGALNPTEAELTEPGNWPGVTSFRHSFGETIEAERPEIYFSERRPERVSCVLSPLSCAFPELREESVEGDEIAVGTAAASALPGDSPRPSSAADRESEARIRALVDTRTTEIRRDLAARGERFAGPERVMRMSPTKRSTHPLRRLNPRFATRDPDLLAWAIADRRQFEVEHEKAKRRYIAGRRRTVFPLGTYGYRVVLGVRVARAEERRKTAA